MLAQFTNMVRSGEITTSDRASPALAPGAVAAEPLSSNRAWSASNGPRALDRYPQCFIIDLSFTNADLEGKRCQEWIITCALSKTHGPASTSVGRVPSRFASSMHALAVGVEGK